MSDFGCPGCYQTARGQQELLSTAREKAKKYATEIQSTVAICKEGFEYFWAIESVARTHGYHILELVSQHPAVTAA